MDHRMSPLIAGVMMAVFAIAVDAIAQDKIILKDVPYVVQQARLD